MPTFELLRHRHDACCRSNVLLAFSRLMVCNQAYLLDILQAAKRLVLPADGGAAQQGPEKETIVRGQKGAAPAAPLPGRRSRPGANPPPGNAPLPVDMKI